MDNCLFCKIVKGEVPSYKVYEDDDFFAFLDIRPMTKGHTLVIPKEHYRWVYDVPNFGEYWEVSKEIGDKLMKSLGAEWMSFLTHGLVPHAHIHILPRFQDVNVSPEVPRQTEMTKEELEETVKKITSG